MLCPKVCGMEIEMKNIISGFINFIKGIYKDKNMILQLAKNDFKAKYTNSMLGAVWAFITPLITILVLWFVFQVGFRSTPVNNIPFILWYIPAFLSWNFFTEAISSASNSLLEYNYLVKKIRFRVSILPLMKIISASFVHIFFIGFIFLIFLLYGHFPSIYNLQVVYYYIAMVILLLGLTWLTSSLTAFSKDIMNIISVIIQVGFWMTPIIWSAENMPILVQYILKLNPMYYICNGYRESFINEKWFWESPALTGYYWIFTIIIFLLGANVFYKLRPQFADVL